MKTRAPIRTSALYLALLAAFAAVAPAQAAAGGNAFVQTNLVANSAKYKPTAMIDPDLVNPWGIALRPPGAGGHIWTSNAGTGTTTTYIGDVKGMPLHQDGLKVVPIVTSARDRDPFATGSDGVAQVTGQVYNAASDIAGQPQEFVVSGPAINYSTGQPVGTISGAAKFVFVTMDGTINAWRSKTDPGMLEAVVVKDYSMINPASHGLRVAPGYTGVAMSTEAWRLNEAGVKVADNRLYAADFANGRIQTFDNQWNDISSAHAFARPAGLSESYNPFNIQMLGDRLYVAWAENSYEIDEPTEEIPGAGFGRIAVYDRDGKLLQDFTEHDQLNAPWGMAIAPDSFGAFAGALLVANFGDGTITGFDIKTGASLGYLRDTQGEVISIDGIWGLTFGNGVALGDANALYFTAGPDEERDGLFGRLTVSTVPEPGSTALMVLGLGALGALRRRQRG